MKVVTASVGKQKHINDYLHYKMRSYILDSIQGESNMAFAKAEDKKDGAWDIVGWINATSKNSYTVKDKNNELLGFVSKQKLDDLVAGKVKGVAISVPKKTE
jgi:hypothetical protein